MPVQTEHAPPAKVDMMPFEADFDPYESMSPSVAEVGGTKMLFSSSPWAKTALEAVVEAYEGHPDVQMAILAEAGQPPEPPKRTSLTAGIAALLGNGVMYE